MAAAAQCGRKLVRGESDPLTSQKPLARKPKLASETAGGGTGSLKSAPGDVPVAMLSRPPHQSQPDMTAGSNDVLLVQQPVIDDNAPASETASATLLSQIAGLLDLKLAPVTSSMSSLQEDFAAMRTDIEERVDMAEVNIDNIHSSVEALTSTVNDKFDEAMVRIEKLEDLISDGASSRQVLSSDDIEGIDRTAAVVGGLEKLAGLAEAGRWLSDKLKELEGPQPTRVEMKSKEFKGVVVAKFTSGSKRDEAVAALRAAGLEHESTQVWAKEDLPIHINARKSFLNSLRYQLKQWGLVYNEMIIDKCYTTLSVGLKVAVKISIEDGVMKYAWCEQWLAWQELQASHELQLLKTKATADLAKAAKGKGKSKYFTGAATVAAAMPVQDPWAIAAGKGKVAGKAEKATKGC